MGDTTAKHPEHEHTHPHAPTSYMHAHKHTDTHIHAHMDPKEQQRKERRAPTRVIREQGEREERKRGKRGKRGAEAMQTNGPRKQSPSPRPWQWRDTATNGQKSEDSQTDRDIHAEREAKRKEGCGGEYKSRKRHTPENWLFVFLSLCACVAFWAIGIFFFSMVCLHLVGWPKLMSRPSCRQYSSITTQTNSFNFIGEYKRRKGKRLWRHI